MTGDCCDLNSSGLVGTEKWKNCQLLVERRLLQQVVVSASKNPSSGLIHHVASGGNVYILLVNREWGHYREISDRGLDVMTERTRLINYIIWPF